MNVAGTFRLDEPQVICEVLKHELILIHFESGLCYDIRGIGADVCQMLMAGQSVHEAATRLAGHHHLSVATVEAEVESFVSRLMDEKLLVPSESPRQDDQPVELSPGKYEPPTFEKFDDMAGQLLLDRIEDEAQPPAWPTSPAAPASS